MRYTEFRKLNDQDPTQPPPNPTPPPIPGVCIMCTPAAQNFKSMQTDLQKAIANLNLKDQASIDILKQLYTVLNKQDIESRMKTIFSKDNDNRASVLEKMADRFLKIYGKDPANAKNFLDTFDKNGATFVDITALTSNAGTRKKIEDVFTTPIAKQFGRSLISLQGPGYKTSGNAGPGEVAFAALSNQIKLGSGGEDGGDIIVGDTPYEVKGGGKSGGGGRLFDKGQIEFTKTLKHLTKSNMARAGNLTAQVAASIDPDTQDYEPPAQRDPEKDYEPTPGRSPQAGITSDPNIWVNQSEKWWKDYWLANIEDWAKSYGNAGGFSVSDVAGGLADRMGTRQFLTSWFHFHFNAYKEKAGHTGIFLVGSNSFVLGTEYTHLLPYVKSFGNSYQQNISQTRDITIQLGLK